MKIVLSYKKTDEIAIQLPEGISGDIKRMNQDGIDGETVIQIINAVLSRGSEIATIAGFIYMIMRDKHAGSITIEGKPVAEPYDEEDIKVVLSDALSDDIDKSEN